ncbi:substrate-binding domain-containing protein [Streptomyces sp. CA-210063]|uniref:substrate-binding domain-containing protein n=1 Tax=Streptomyces sp. CA-210063 TaxID=2801029 RepID=UPI00214A903A|nr:substrate-binding domain-containing protein [Streptomyces sp. CA-210063]UUU31299.1 substrate-binding domain-containing protein [Streptomyces sp. CA-210063]
MNVISRARLGAVLGAAVLGVGVFAAPALADPPAGDYRVLAGAGSDTTQDVLNGIGDAVDGGRTIASYNATPTGTVKTREVNCEIARPNGSSAGVTALNTAVDTNSGCLDFARSSRGPADTSTSQDLTFIPFAKDAVSVAVRDDSALNNDLDLTTAQLAAIFRCDAGARVLNGVTLTPLLPQLNSGTRTFFLGRIGVTEAQVGSCVATMQEHNGLALDTAGDIAPYSIAQYISQVTNVVEDRHGATALGRIDGSEPFTAEGTLNTGFVYNRDVYNVVPTAKLTDPVIDAVFTGTDSKVCTAVSAGQSVIEKYGFGRIDHCGDTTDPALKGER